MTYDEAQEFILKKFLVKIHDRLGEQFPGMYVGCHSLDQEELDANNHIPYGWYGAIGNSLFGLGFKNEYTKKHDKEHTTEVQLDGHMIKMKTELHNSFSYLEEMYEDFCKTDNPIGWCIAHIPHRIGKGK